jgi:hypothetical protein
LGTLKDWAEAESDPPAQIVIDPVGTPRPDGIGTPLIVEVVMARVETAFDMTVPVGGLGPAGL